MNCPARILMAVGMKRHHGLVLATDSTLVAWEVDEISCWCDDLGVDVPDEPGLFLWEGHTVSHGGRQTWVGDEEPYTEYVGSARRLTDPAEIVTLFEMRPPEILCHECSKDTGKEVHHAPPPCQPDGPEGQPR